MWPGGRKDTAALAWLALTAGGQAMMDRYDGVTGGASGLRQLRNNLEDAHGDAGSTEHATLDDLHALCAVWQAILVAPY